MRKGPLGCHMVTALLAALSVGCGRSAAVQTAATLPLRRVVVYRNGVGYFERQGRVREREVNFRVAPREVGDFLATLAVMERGGSSVRAAAFPVPEEDGGEAREGRRTVRLALDGDDHDLRVGYTVETPIWRPSYRLVFNGDTAHVQAWGIVQNLSGEDWSDVSLSLVAGAPVSFRSELARAVIPTRPVVTDQGAVIDAVPVGDVTLAQGGESDTPAAQAPSSEASTGLGLDGTGVGGGGVGEGTIGLGGLGTLGHGAGSGGGQGYGSGAGGALRERRAAAPTVRAGAASVQGALSSEVVRRVVQRNIAQVRYCYERSLATNPGAQGRVIVRFIIAPSGQVSASSVAASTLPDAGVGVCIANALRRWQFPAPEGGGVVSVSYPFNLAPGGAAAGDARAEVAANEREGQSAAPRNVNALAALAAQGGVTRYDLPQRVTVPDRSATMVMLAARDVPGERMYLFAPDPGVSDSRAHPFHVARFVNRTGALLERGPVAIFEEGAFLGQGMLDALPDAASATVPFALERALSVEHAATDAVEGARLVSMQRGTVNFERFQVRRTTYRVRNGLEREARVMLRHALEGAEPHDPPAGTERSNGNALVPARVPARGSAEVVLTTRSPFTVAAEFGDEQAAAAVAQYLREGSPAADVAAALRSALELRERIEVLSRERGETERRRDDLQQGTEETRENLRAIQRNPQAADLRAQLTARLARAATEVDQLTRRIVELDTQISERRVRLTETLRGIEIDVARPRAPSP